MGILAIVGFLAPTLSVALESGDLLSAFSSFFRSLSNSGMIGYLGLGILILSLHASRRIFLALVAVPFMLVLTPFLQTKIVALLLLVFALTPLPRATLSASLAGFLALWACALFFIEEVRLFEPTLAVRLEMQRDAVAAFVESYGLGVGFGTEAVTPKTFLGELNWAAGSNIADVNERWIFISPHNSFATMFFRMGLVGGALFLILVFSVYPRGSRGRLVRIWSFGYFVFFIATFSNPTIESPAYHVGAAIVFGLMMQLMERSKNGDEGPLLLT